MARGRGVGVAREGARALIDRVGMLIAERQHHIAAAVVEIGADRGIGAEDVAVALLGDLLAGGHLDAREIAAGDEVDHARHRVGAVGHRRAAGQRVDALDQRQRNVVEVDAADRARGNDALAVEQDEVAEIAEAAKVGKAEPPLPLLTALPMLGTAPGRSRSTSSALLVWRSWSSSWPTTETGAEASRLGLRIRVPVTTIAGLLPRAARRAGRSGPAEADRPARKRASRRRTCQQSWWTQAASS